MPATQQNEPEVIFPFSRGQTDNYDFGLSRDAFDVYRILNDHRKECEQSGDYDAARLTRLRLNRMRGSQMQKKQDSMQNRHSTAREQLLHEQSEEMKNYLKLTEEKENPTIEATVQRLEEDLKERQEVEFIQFLSQLSAQVYKPKFSPEVLNLKRRMQMLGVQGNYNQAKKVQARINKLIAEEETKNKEKIKEKYERVCNIFRMKQKKEYDALMLKIESVRIQKKKRQEKQKELYEKKHRKGINNLDGQQGIEKSKAKKLPQLGTIKKSINIADTAFSARTV